MDRNSLRTILLLMPPRQQNRLFEQKLIDAKMFAWLTHNRKRGAASMGRFGGYSTWRKQNIALFKKVTFRR